MTKRLEDAQCLTESECLLIDPRADRETLFDHTEQRLDAVKDLMFTLSTIDSGGGNMVVSDLSNIAMVSRLLLGDASDMLIAARGYKSPVTAKREHAGGRHE